MDDKDLLVPVELLKNIDEIVDNTDTAATEDNINSEDMYNEYMSEEQQRVDAQQNEDELEEENDSILFDGNEFSDEN
jgi:hypothetical protein